MARKKPDAIKPIADLKQADAALAEIAGLTRQLAAIGADLNESIDCAKAQAEADASPLHARIKAIENGLQAFGANQKKTLFADRRSKVLDYGTIGFRKSSQIKPQPRTTWKMVLGRIKELAFVEAIRTKEDVNKEELSTWSGERLGIIGARRVEKDLFWYELDQEKIADKTG